MAMADESATGGVAVTPSDASDLPQGLTSGIIIKGAAATADVAVSFAQTPRVSVTLTLATGFVHPLKVIKVFSTGTTATGVVALY